MRQLLILLNLLYIALVPALAIIIQGGLSHDFALSFLPDYISKYMLGFAYIYAIVMVMMLSFMVNKESDSRVF
jgi:membrane-bound acyltransferase YfiQ involved in biofilm formation